MSHGAAGKTVRTRSSTLRPCRGRQGGEAAPVRIIRSVEELKSLIGEEVGVSDWIEMTQERINLFAEATEDHQWIHVDPERAAKESPYKLTIAHGFLTLALLAHLYEQTVRVAGEFKMGVNYGLNRVRFAAPAPSGSRIRGRFTILQVDEHDWGVQMSWGVRVEVEGSEKPAVAAEWITRAYR